MVKEKIKSKQINLNINSLYQKHDLFKKGSEAFLYFGNFMGKKVVIKERKPKKYRHSKLDKELRLSRLRSEARILNIALKENIPVPHLLGIDLLNYSLIFQYIYGDSLGLIQESQLTNVNKYYQQLGRITGLLHLLNIIHGDLTPNNMLINPGKGRDQLYLIDFGLSYISPDVEAKTMDLFILHKSIPDKTWFNIFIKSYEQIMPSQNIKKHLRNIFQRGRYIKRNKLV